LRSDGLRETYRRVRIESKFGKLTASLLTVIFHILRAEMTGYEVTNLAETLTKAKAAAANVLVPQFKTDERDAAVVRFPEGTSLRSTRREEIGLTADDRWKKHGRAQYDNEDTDGEPW